MDTSNIIEQLKNCELDILRHYIIACLELNVSYYLLGGTMLGAVRHGGFIPWDDDIDVAMPRKDYEIFIHKGQALLPDNLFIQTHETDPEFPAAYAKIRNSDTTFIESGLRNRKINHGVWIDVFPLDYYPKDPNRRLILRNRWNRYSFRIARACYSRTPQNEKSSLIKKAEREIRALLYSIMLPDVEGTILKREKMIKSEPESGFYVNWSGAWGKKEVAPVSWFGAGVTLKFEDIYCMVPAEYDKWLKQVYGNYMQFPPEEKRISHHYVDKIDLNKPYTESN